MVAIRELREETFRPYGWTLIRGRQPTSLAFSNAVIDFWEEHLFDPGLGGETQILRVNYRDRGKTITRLESHRLTQQVVIPLTGDIVQIVAQSHEDGSANPATLSAFRVKVGEGICMRSGCWHTTRIEEDEVKCLMLTRRSTTVDLISHLQGASPLIESALAEVNAQLA